MSATAQPKAPRQQSLPLPVKIPSRSKRGISAASLRPGDHLRRDLPYGASVDLIVIQNWASAGRIEIGFRDDGARFVIPWDQLNDVRHVGPGRRRWWWRVLPELCRKYISEFSRP